MYTRCPHCQTTFRIAEDHLKAAKGMVRCGSCQQVFDARLHLSSGVPSEPPSKKPKPTPAPAPPRPIVKPPTNPSLTPSSFSFDDFDDPDEHDHIDLSVPVSRESMPDQSRFMESIYEENSPYNNLDDMGKIHVPGDLNFGESFIKFAETNDKQDFIITDAPLDNEPEVAAEPKRPPNPYEDIEGKEAPATTTEHAAINELYKNADQQMSDDDQLQKNIEELLSFATELDDKPPSHPDYELSPHLHELADFEKEIDNFDFDDSFTSLGKGENTTTRTPKIEKPKVVDNDDDFDRNFHIHVEEENTETPQAVLDIKIQKPEPKETASQTDEVTAPAPRIKKDKPERVRPQSPATTEDELPSAAFEIPKALRRNFENFEPPLRPIGQTIGMIALLVVLVFGFLFQLFFFRSYEMANQFPALTPVLTSICNGLPCRYSGSLDVSQIELINRDVRSHPTQKNALLISAAFINHARFDQPYPTIAVKLADLGGHVVATRHFKPEEYLDKLYSKFLLMESGTPIHITLAVLDPGDDAINFEFSFL